ncbi:MAG: VWA domain-containing protein [Treponema sp.]|uniref:vWA domain-containing protein n=1 Tax=Treponema sp. TaxID=166 RepID=UPI0025CBEA85|nr:vWA domain-containing protein [Treponema sp.]MBQ9621991.1 VWA domain-containing protein [Treponema sp.]MBR0099513.1 VWA domain-containing protein [Treponema sp.]MBR0496425.1 VWA domain-containing protein [Treponema sp.]
MKKYVFLLFLTVFSVAASFAAEDILIHPEDLRLVYDDGANFDSAKGYHLYIRKKTRIESVMLVETTKDPEGKEDNYAYRALEYNSINGDEIRYLNGKVLDSPGAKYPLMDSTPEPDPVFGEAFHIFIPSEIAYGYPWTRNGVLKIGRGTFINIRSFEKKYGDYTGDYADNPFMFDLGKAVAKKRPLPPPEPEPDFPEIEEPAVREPEVPAPVPEPLEPESVDEEPEVILLTDDYNPDAAESFKNIAAFGGGEMVYSKGPETLPDDIMAALDRIGNKDEADVVFAIDTTGSMKDDIQKLRKVWIPQMFEKIKDFKSLRLGLLLYRDYGDTYKWMNLPVKKFEFTDRIEDLRKNLNGFHIYGTEGGDIPEAVYEALFASLEYYNWRSSAERKIILIGDAEPHPKPRGSGKYSKELVASLAEQKGIKIDAIIVPDNKSDRGR